MSLIRTKRFLLVMYNVYLCFGDYFLITTTFIHLKQVLILDKEYPQRVECFKENIHWPLKLAKKYFSVSIECEI